jgi:hypothetical protein
MAKIKSLLVSASALLLPALASAQAADNGPGVYITSLSYLVGFIEHALWIVFGGIAVICFVVAGILFLTAGGAPEKVTAARSAFIWGIAGVVVGILAYSIVAIVTSVMGGGA